MYANLALDEQTADHPIEYTISHMAEPEPATEAAPATDALKGPSY